MENKGRIKTTKIEVFRILFLNINMIESICLIAVKVWKFLSTQKTIRLKKNNQKKILLNLAMKVWDAILANTHDAFILIRQLNE